MGLAERFAREDAEAEASEQFEVFWRAYPRRIGKGGARKKFEQAIRKTDLATMLTAIKLYVRCKPSWMDFKHPATWLHNECWDDEWDTPAPSRNYADAARNISNGAESLFGHSRDVQQFPAIERRH